MNKNMILAFGLSALVLIVFQVFFAPKPAPVAPDKQQTTAAAKVDTKQPAVSLDMNKPAATKTKLQTFSVPTDNAIYTFNAVTGNLRQAAITKYGNREIKDIVFAARDKDSYYVDVPLIQQYKGAITKSGDDTVVTFTGSHGGMVVVKKYIISKKDFLINGQITVSNTGAKTLNLPVRMGLNGGIIDSIKSDKYTFSGPLMYDGKRLKTEKADKVSDPVVVDKPMWVGYTSKYFMAAIARSFDKGTVVKDDKTADIYGDTQLQVNPSDNKTLTFSIFTGPKEYDLMRGYNLKLEKGIDFGIFSFIAIPMLKFLKIIFGLVHNYGVAIILLTVVVKLITLPLTHKSMVSMRKMGALAPKLNELKEKYKADKEKMNAATMELYKKEGVNPFGGCLPMLLQIPIFFALYRTLLLAIELQGAPFFGWITDLSLKDPYYITPVIMGVTMFIQQRMTPSTAQDPMQQKMFMLMPFIFTFMFLAFPAGLVVYWLTNNVLSIGQQYYINKKLA